MQESIVHLTKSWTLVEKMVAAISAIAWRGFISLPHDAGYVVECAAMDEQGWDAQASKEVCRYSSEASAVWRGLLHCIRGMSILPLARSVLSDVLCGL